MGGAFPNNATKQIRNSVEERSFRDKMLSKCSQFTGSRNVADSLELAMIAMGGASFSGWTI